MKQWLQRYVGDIIYLWVAVAAALCYTVTGDTGYLVASMLGPVSQYFYAKGDA